MKTTFVYCVAVMILPLRLLGESGWTLRCFAVRRFRGATLIPRGSNPHEAEGHWIRWEGGRVSFVFPVTALTASSCTVSVLTELLSLLCPCRRGPHSSFTNKLAYTEKRLIQVYVSICVFLLLIPVVSTSQDQAKGARITLLAASWNWHLGKKAQQRPPLREGITVSSHAR